MALQGGCAHHRLSDICSEPDVPHTLANACCPAPSPMCIFMQAMRLELLPAQEAQHVLSRLRTFISNHAPTAPHAPGDAATDTGAAAAAAEGAAATGAKGRGRAASTVSISRKAVAKDVQLAALAQLDAVACKLRVGVTQTCWGHAYTIILQHWMADFCRYVSCEPSMP